MNTNTYKFSLYRRKPKKNKFAQENNNKAAYQSSNYLNYTLEYITQLGMQYISEYILNIYIIYSKDILTILILAGWK